MSPLTPMATIATMRGPAKPPGWLCRALLSALALALGGCATLNRNAGFAAVEGAVQQRLGKDLQWVRSEANLVSVQTKVAQLLTQPLTVEDAVHVALLNNRGLQARLADLGIGESERVQASRPANPGISLARLRRGDEQELERSLHLGLASLIAWPWQRELAEQQFSRVQAEVTAAMLALAIDTRKAYFQALAAAQTLGYRRQVLQAAQASAELARRMQ